MKANECYDPMCAIHPVVTKSDTLNRYRVEWKHTHPMWGDVEAIDELEAVRLARAGKFIKGSIDSDPGKDDFNRPKVKLLPTT